MAERPGRALVTIDYSIPEMTGRLNRRFFANLTNQRVWRAVTERSLGHQRGSRWRIPVENEERLAEALGLLAPQQKPAA